MKMFNELGALVLWGLALFMASTLNLPVALAEEKKSTPEDFRALSDEDIKDASEYRKQLQSMGLLAETFLNLKREPMTSEEIDKLRLDWFKLFLNCEPVDTVVEELSDDAKRTGLTKEAIIAAAESRLRAARIYNNKKNSTPYLHITVTVVGDAFSIEVALNKYLFDDETSMLHGVAKTWTKTLIGTHTNDATFILSGLSRLLDLFIADYLRVNEIACKYKEK